jgi:dual specificity tyrosine-phosphorylation-regulated kinase 2/3/4
LETEEFPSNGKLPFTPKTETLAQRIPRLPESKFFPSSTRNKNASLDSNPYSSTSINSTKSKIENKTVTNTHNLSLQSQVSNENLMNFSQFSGKDVSGEATVKWTDVNLPVSPLVVIGKFNDKLTRYELAEILKFPQVWCIGLEANKIKSSGSSDNFGYDDENNDYKAVMHDHIGYRYELFEILGKGSFGHVYRVFDYKHKTFCALKIIKNKKRFNQQALVEIDILRTLRKKDELGQHNVVHIQSSFSFRSHIVIPK